VAKVHSDDVDWYVVVYLRAHCASFIQISCDEIQTSQRLKFKIQAFLFYKVFFAESNLTFPYTAQFTYAELSEFAQSA
jgi:hypothetical protein